MTIERHDDERATVIRLTGDIGIQHAAQMRTTLLDAFGRGCAVRIDVAGVTDVQVPAFQLLCSAHRTSLQKAIAIALLPGGSEAFLQAVAVAGLPQAVGCPGGSGTTCLWTREAR